MSSVTPAFLQAFSPTAAAPQPDSRVVLNLSDYTAQIAGRAAQGSGSPARSLTQTNPLAFSALAMLPVACSGGGGGGGDTGITDGGTGGSDSGTGGDTGVGGDSGTGGSDGGTVQTFGTASIHDTVPCATYGYIPDLAGAFGVCGDFVPSPHHLFSWDPSTAGAVSSLMVLNSEPFQAMLSSSGDYYITNIGDPLTMPAIPAGLTVANPGMGSQSQYVFPTFTLPSSQTASDGSSVSSLDPSHARGLAEVGNRIFVATANKVPNAGNPAQSYFNPGTVAVFDRTTGTFTDFILTTDYNPNSIVAAGGRVYVVNGGDYNPDRVPPIAGPSSIDVIDPDTLEVVQNIPLGNVAAGIPGEAAVSADGSTMALTTADNSGNIVVVDLEAGTSREVSVTAAASVSLTGISLDPTGRYAYVGSFNDGVLYLVDLDTDTVVDSEPVDTMPADFFGITHVLQQGVDVFVSVGNQVMRVPVMTE